MAKQVLFPAEIDYPDSDGKPLAESDFQFDPLTYARNALRYYYRDRSDVYVAGNMLIYYEEGNVKARVAPDVFVVMGAAPYDRSSYLLWREPKGPDWVLEVTSRSTRREDQGRKRELYRELGVTEYWQFDPTGDYLAPRLQGSELVSGQYEGLAARKTAAGGLTMWSRVLKLELRVQSDGLRFYDPATGEYLLTHAEAEDERRRERQARQAAEHARQAAEQAAAEAQGRVAALEAQLAKGRGSSEPE